MRITNAMPIGLGALGAALPKSKKEKKTEDADARRAEGNEKFARGDYAGAIAAYEEALALNANDASARSNKAECYLRGRMFEKALECAEGAVECASGNKGTKLKAMYKKAMALNGLARYAEAGRVAEEAHADVPDGTRLGEERVVDRSRLIRGSRAELVVYAAGDSHSVQVQKHAPGGVHGVAVVSPRGVERAQERHGVHSD